MSILTHAKFCGFTNDHDPENDKRPDAFPSGCMSEVIKGGPDVSAWATSWAGNTGITIEAAGHQSVTMVTLSPDEFERFCRAGLELVASTKATVPAPRESGAVNWPLVTIVFAALIVAAPIPALINAIAGGSW